MTLQQRERPILFNGPMIRAILDGSKTQTRRAVKPPPTEQLYQISDSAEFAPSDPRDRDSPDFARAILCPYGTPSDRLWVRETWARHPDDGGILYRATDPGWDDNDYGIPWNPSIHMPRWASRLTLEVVSVRVERLQDITPDDAMHEGITAPMLNDSYTTMCAGFALLWDSINSKRVGRTWNDNPYVWVVSFRPVPSE